MMNTGHARDNQSKARPSTPRQEVQQNSPLPSSCTVELTREEIENHIEEYGRRIKEYECNRRDKGKKKAQFNCNLKDNQTKVSNSHQSLLDGMLMIQEQCNAKGYVYGLVKKTSNPVTGASDSLREWWKSQVMFNKTGPIQIEKYYKEQSLNLDMDQENEAKSTTELLMELSDPTLGSILSLLMQHADPPQRKFPFEGGLLPPWWPTAGEDWWGQTGISTEDGPPPFRKPHNLKKKWKVAVILGMIKSMSPKFSRTYTLLKQSRSLQRMNAKELKFWTLALVSEARRYSLEHPDSAEAAAFLQDYGSMTSQMARNADRQDHSTLGNEVPLVSNSSGVKHWPPLAPPSNNPSAWPIPVPPMNQQRRGVELSIAPQYSSYTFSYSPMLPANVPMDAQHNLTIEGLGASSSGFQDNQAPLMYTPFVWQPGGPPPTSGTPNLHNQMHEFGVDMEFGFPPSSSNRNQSSGQ